MLRLFRTFVGLHLADKSPLAPYRSASAYRPILHFARWSTIVIIPKAGRGEDAAGHHNLTQQLLGDSGFVAERGGLQEVVA
jgi:hypothetical protein